MIILFLPFSKNLVPLFHLFQGSKERIETDALSWYNDSVKDWADDPVFFLCAGIGDAGAVGGREPTTLKD